MNAYSNENALDMVEGQPAQFSMGSANLVMDANAMQQMVNLSNFMASARSTIPQHLQGNPGDCLAIVMQATQWGMNPFAVAQKTHFVNGQLGYEGQLVNAVITARAPVTGRIQYEWFGDWQKILGRFKEITNNGKTKIVKDWSLDDEKGLGIRVSATLKGEDEPRVLELLLSQAGVRNSPLWGQDPKQQLAYLAVKRWSRLHCPDVILGVYTVDEFDVNTEEKTVSSSKQEHRENSGSSALKQRLKKNKEAVESTATEIDLASYYKRISDSETLDELDQVGSDIAELNLGEPAKSEIGEAFKSKRKEIKAAQSFPDESVKSIIAEIDSSGDLETLNTIMGTRFEPFLSKMTEQQVDEINKAYEAQEAALTA